MPCRVNVVPCQGWTPTNDIESVVVQIRAQMVVGKARIDFNSPNVTQVRLLRAAWLINAHALVWREAYFALEVWSRLWWWS